MNKYLLLRDNKQTGPYTVSELIQKGIKPYDLVWLDGKSAAWRYPSEIEELKAYAPAVEEQPYDRFYKKPAAEQQEEESPLLNARKKASAAPDRNSIPERIANTERQNTYSSSDAPIVNQTAAQSVYAPLPVEEKAVVKNDPPRKIYVTLPTGQTSKVSQKASPAPETKIVTETVNPVMKLVPANPVVKETPVADETQKESYRPYNSFSSRLDSSFPIADVPSIPARPTEKLPVSRNPKTFMRAIAAICLLMGGIIIGLIISNSRQKTSAAELDNLVKRIQERSQAQKAGYIPPVVVDAPDETTNQPRPENNLPAQTEVSQENKKPATAIKSKQAVTEPADNKNTLPPVVTAPVSTAREEVKIKPADDIREVRQPRNEAAVESTRKNIRQLISARNNKYKTGVLGGISDLSITVSNKSDFEIDQVEVEIEYLGPEKKVVKKQMLVFNNVPAGKDVTLDAPKTSRGVSVNYSIKTIQSKSLGIAHSGM
jgi:hypothetical protein